MIPVPGVDASNLWERMRIMEPEQHADAPEVRWRAIETIPVFLLSLLGTVVLTFAVAAVVSSLLGWSIDRVVRPAASDASGCVAQSVIAVSAQEVAFLATVLLWVRFVSRAPLRALGAPRRPWADVAVGVGMGLLILIASAVVLALTEAVASAILGRPPQEPVQVASCVSSGSALAMMALPVIVAAPVAEETLFRGFLFTGLRRRFSVWPAAVISAALFAAVHLAGSEFLLIIPPLFVVGLGLALLFERRRSLLAAICAHATFNLIGFVSIALSRLG